MEYLLLLKYKYPMNPPITGPKIKLTMTHHINGKRTKSNPADWSKISKA